MTGTLNWQYIAVISALAVFVPSARPQDLMKADDLNKTVVRYLEKQGIPGAVVGIVQNDQVIYRQAFGLRDVEADLPMTPDALFQIGSATKSMTATLMGILRDDDLLGFDDPIGKYLPEHLELPETMGRITLRQLATHTAGLPRNFVNRRDVPGSPSVALPYSVDELYEGLMRTELIELDGKSRYSNIGGALLGHILERVSGMTYDQLLRDRLLAPLGMSSTGIQPNTGQEKRMAVHYWKRDNAPVARARWKFGEVASHGGVFSCVDDLAKYIALQYSTQSGTPLRATTLTELHEPVIRFEDSRNTWLATGWFVIKVPGATIINHDGGVDGNSASIGFIKERKLGVIALTNRGGDTAGDLAQIALRAAMRGTR